MMDRILLFLSVAPILLVVAFHFLSSIGASLDEASGMPGVTSICLNCGETKRIRYAAFISMTRLLRACRRFPSSCCDPFPVGAASPHF